MVREHSMQRSGRLNRMLRLLRILDSNAEVSMDAEVASMAWRQAGT